MSFDSLLNNTCTIQVATETQATDGEMVLSWATYQSNVPIMITGSNGGRRDFKSDIVAIMTHVGYIKYNATMTWNKYRVVMNSVTYEILDISNPRNANHHLELALQVTK